MFQIFATAQTTHLHLPTSTQNPAIIHHPSCRAPLPDPLLYFYLSVKYRTMSLPQIPNIPQIPPSTRGRVCKNGGSHGPQHRFRTQRIRIDFGALQYPYSDDDAELQLRSEDGAIFKVQAFYLKAAR